MASWDFFAGLLMPNTFCVAEIKWLRGLKIKFKWFLQNKNGGLAETFWKAFSWSTRLPIIYLFFNWCVCARLYGCYLQQEVCVIAGLKHSQSHAVEQDGQDADALKPGGEKVKGHNCNIDHDKEGEAATTPTTTIRTNRRNIDHSNEEKTITSWWLNPVFFFGPDRKQRRTVTITIEQEIDLDSP